MQREFCKHYMENRCSQAEMATTEGSLAKIKRDVLTAEDDDVRKLYAMVGGIPENPADDHVWPDVEESNTEESSEASNGESNGGSNGESSSGENSENSKA